MIARLDPALPITDLQSMTEIVALEIAARETQIAVLALLATAAVLLPGVRPTDIPTFVTAATVIPLMTLSGSAIPALRALSIDPASALRR